MNGGRWRADLRRNGRTRPKAEGGRWKAELRRADGLCGGGGIPAVAGGATSARTRVEYPYSGGAGNGRAALGHGAAEPLSSAAMTAAGATSAYAPGGSV